MEIFSSIPQYCQMLRAEEEWLSYTTLTALWGALSHHQEEKKREGEGTRKY